MLLTEGRWIVHSLLVGAGIATAAWAVNFIVIYIVEWWEQLHPPCDLPILNLEGWRFGKAKQEYMTNLDHYLRIGRSKHRENGYQLWSPEGYKVILPPRFYEEAGPQNDDVMSNDAARMRILGGYNILPKEMFMEAIAIAKKHLQGSMSFLGNQPSELIQAHMLAKFPRTEDWTELVLFPPLFATVAAANTTILFGKELGEEPKILQAATTFPLDLVTYGLKLRKLAYPYKVLAVELGLMPEAVKVRNWIKYACEAVPPVVKARQEAIQHDPTYKKPNDLVQWCYDALIAPNPGASTSLLGAQTLFAMTAAVHTTGMNLVNVVHHVAWFPQHNKALREEIDKVWQESNGNINASNAAQLDKLDSYIMEASRHGAFKRINIDRDITSKTGFTFSNGLHLRRGACIALDITGQEMDPALWGDPHEFLPFRFSDARAQAVPGERKMWFTSTNPRDAMQFGHGKHSCPGRGFATLMLKIFMATLLHEFDVEPLKGAKFPKPVDMGTVSSPPTDVALRFRKRKV